MMQHYSTRVRRTEGSVYHKNVDSAKPPTAPSAAMMAVLQREALHVGTPTLGSRVGDEGALVGGLVNSEGALLCVGVGGLV